MVPLVLVLPVPHALWGCGWVWNVVVGDRGGWFGTLLGPEGSALAGCLWPPSAAGPCDAGWWWLVGLLFEICIVDASIFVAIVVVLCL